MLVETFGLSTEDDYYEWVKNHLHFLIYRGNPDWGWIRHRIKYYKNNF